MDQFAGLDVAVKETSVCIVDDTGKIVREVKVASEPDSAAGGGEELAPIASSGLGWKPGRCRKWLLQRAGRSRVTGRSVSRRDTCRRC